MSNNSTGSDMNYSDSDPDSPVSSVAYGENEGLSSSKHTKAAGLSGGANSDSLRPYQLYKQVSTSFHREAHLKSTPTDVVLLSNDQILFYTHRHTLVDPSSNNFNGLLRVAAPSTAQRLSIIPVPQSSDILNILLHSLYEIPCNRFHPTFEHLYAAVDALIEYGMEANRFLARGTPLYEVILSFAPLFPVEAYALAAAQKQECLAVTISPYTLRVKLHLVSPELVRKMDWYYMFRLQRLHGTRMDILRELLEKKVYPHVPVSHCTPLQRQIVSRAFQLAAAQIFFDASPALSKTSIEVVTDGLIANINCPDCKKAVKCHVEELVTRWMLLDRTI